MIGNVVALAAVLMLSSESSFAGTHNHKAHVHGAAKLALAIESPTEASISLDVPAESIYGFEHRANTPKDKKAQKAGLQKLRESGAQLLHFDPALKCAVKTDKVGMEAEGEHADVNASYTVHCEKPMTGSSVTVGLQKLFPRIKNVSLEVLSPSGQSETKVKDDTQAITL